MNLHANPIWDKQKQIIDSLRRSQAIMVVAETSTGKTTQLPPMLYKNGFANGKIIGVSEPRRLVAVYGANRVSEETNTRPGELCGYQVRFSDTLSPTIKIKYATEGIFLQEAKFDPLFLRYSVLILDEVHEMTIEMTILLGLVKQAIEARPDFKVVLSSATVDTTALQEFFEGNIELIECKGREFPLGRYYEESDPTEKFTSYMKSRMLCRPIYEWPELSADKASTAIKAGENGNILVILAGQEELKRAKNHFETQIAKEQLNSSPEVKLAYGEMDIDDLKAVIGESERQRVIFATNVAETGITIPGVTLVIDSGRVKLNRYNSSTGVVEIVEYETSQASSTQRAGRAARTAPGRCWHLFTKENYERRKQYTTPAIQRSSLTSTALLLAKIGIKHIEDFPLIYAPDWDNIRKAYRELLLIGAICREEGNASNWVITDYGEMLSRFPMDPHYAHLLVQAHEQGALKEMATFLAMYQARVFFKPKKDLKEDWRQIVAHCKSDPEILLELWDQYNLNNFQYEWAKSIGLRANAMHEARQIRSQLLKIASDQEMISTVRECKFVNFKRALVKALPNNFALYESFGRQSGYRHLSISERCQIHPSSILYGEMKKLVWAFDTHKTTTTYLNCLMGVTLEEIQECCPEVVQVRYYKRGSWSGNEISVYKQIRLQGVEVFEKMIKHLPYFESDEELGAYSTRDLTEGELTVLLAEISAQEDAQKQAAKIYRDVHERLLSEARDILNTLPIVPGNVRMLADRWRFESRRNRIVEYLPLDFHYSPSGYGNRYLTDENVQLAKEIAAQFAIDLVNAIEAAQEREQQLEEERRLCEEEQRRLAEEAARLRAQQEQERAERAQKLVECQEFFDCYVAEDLGKCPMCYQVINGSASCNCVVPEYVEIPDNQLPAIGETQRNLVWLTDEKGRILARIYLERPIEGPRQIVREVNPLDEPFIDIQVHRI